jgi:hypothetical protein
MYMVFAKSIWFLRNPGVCWGGRRLLAGQSGESLRRTPESRTEQFTEVGRVLESESERQRLGGHALQEQPHRIVQTDLVDPAPGADSSLLAKILFEPAPGDPGVGGHPGDIVAGSTCPVVPISDAVESAAHGRLSGDSVGVDHGATVGACGALWMELSVSWIFMRTWSQMGSDKYGHWGENFSEI